MEKHALTPDHDLDLQKLVYLGWPVVRWINRFFTIYVFDFLTSLQPTYVVGVGHHHLDSPRDCLRSHEEKLPQLRENTCTSPESRSHQCEVSEQRGRFEATTRDDGPLFSIWFQSARRLFAHVNSDADLDCDVQFRAECH